MHVSGKILAGLVVVALLGAFYMTTKAFYVRDKWMQLAQENEAAIKKNAEELEAKTRTRNEKRADFARTMLGWDREWNSAGAILDDTGRIGLNIGSNQQVQAGQLLYVFAPNADGTSVYLGDFTVDKLFDAGIQAVPNSRRRPADLKAGQFPSARVRTMIPNPYVKRLGDLDQDLLNAELSIRTNKEELARQGRLSEQADKLIAARLFELNGPADGDNQQARAVPEVYNRGLLTSIVSEEEARNAALIEADRLMRELKKTRDEFQAIRKDNLQRVNSWPKATPAQSASR
jgi:hypothetical protein